MYLFHPRYLHNDIFRYMTCEIDICYFRCKLITLIVIATGQTCHFSRFLQLPSSNLKLLNWVKAAAKMSARVWEAPTTNFKLWVTCPSSIYSSEDS